MSETTHARLRRRGLFITLEGGEGAGKTSQINRLAAFLEEQGHIVHRTREPGGTPEAERVRELIVRRDGGAWTPMAELFLICAARTMHIHTLIAPALERGEIVLCDRFTDSTTAYQGYGRGIGIEDLQAVQKRASGALVPDLTFILDIDVQTGLSRSGKRLSAHDEDGQTEDRFERLDASFHERVREGFLAIAQSEPERCRVIDASQSIDAIFETIREQTCAYLGARQKAEAAS